MAQNLEAGVPYTCVNKYAHLEATHPSQPVLIVASGQRVLVVDACFRFRFRFRVAAAHLLLDVGREAPQPERLELVFVALTAGVNLFFV